MKNMTKTEIALVIVTIAVIAFEGFALYEFFAHGVPMNWGLFTVTFASLTVAFCSIEDKRKKAKKELEASAN